MLACTLDRAREIGLPAMLLPGWYDVDEPQDVLRLQKEFAGQAPCTSGVASGPAFHTRALLAEWAGAETVSL